MVCALICRIPSGVTLAESNWGFTNVVLPLSLIYTGFVCELVKPQTALGGSGLAD